jgi:hypothetical protein
VLGGTSVGLAAGGHVLGGGHAEPVFIGLLVVAATLFGHAWLSRERGLLAIICAVVGVQAGVHVGLTVGHDHHMSTAMLLTHAGAAVLLGALLRAGEARIHAALRRRALRLMVAVRLLAAGLPAPLPMTAVPMPQPLLANSVWNPAPASRRGPPATL